MFYVNFHTGQCHKRHSFIHELLIAFHTFYSNRNQFTAYHNTTSMHLRTRTEYDLLIRFYSSFSIYQPYSSEDCCLYSYSSITLCYGRCTQKSSMSVRIPSDTRTALSTQHLNHKIPYLYFVFILKSVS